jgi:hypothetical protein
MCRGCRKSAADAALFDCAACRLAKYCSKECQVQHWPKHKEECDYFREAKKEYQKK